MTICPPHLYEQESTDPRNNSLYTTASKVSKSWINTSLKYFKHKLNTITFMKGEFIMAVAELQHIPQSSLHCLCMCVLVWVWLPLLTLHSPAHLPSISSTLQHINLYSTSSRCFSYSISACLPACLFAPASHQPATHQIPSLPLPISKPCNPWNKSNSFNRVWHLGANFTTEFIAQRIRLHQSWWCQ